MKGCRRRHDGLAAKFHGWNSSFVPVPVPVLRKIVEGDHRNPNLFLPLVLQLQSWESVSVCLTYDSRPDCATDSAVNMIDDGPRYVPDSLIDHVEESEISHAEICQYPNATLAIPWIASNVSDDEA